MGNIKWSRHTVGDIEMGDKTRDTMYLIIQGVSTVDFLDKDRISCLTSIQTGVMNVVGDPWTNYAECAAYDRDLGW